MRLPWDSVLNVMTKRRLGLCSAMVRFDRDALRDSENTSAPATRRSARAKPAAASKRQNQAVERTFPRWARRPIDARDVAFFAGAGLALLDTILRDDPPFAGAQRQRLALRAAALCINPHRDAGRKTKAQIWINSAHSEPIFARPAEAPQERLLLADAVPIIEASGHPPFGY